MQFVVLDPLGNFDTGTVRLIVVPGLELVERPVPYPFGLGLSFRGAIFATGLPPVTALGPGTATVFVKTRLGEQETSWGWGSAGLTSLSTRVRFEIAVAGGPELPFPSQQL